MNNTERLGEILKSLEKQGVEIGVQFELLRVLAADCAHRLDNIAARASGLPDLSPKNDSMDELTFELAFAIEDPCGAEELRLARAVIALVRAVSGSHRIEMAVALEALAKRQEEFPNEPEPEPTKT